jgi:hypothetical protein
LAALKDLTPEMIALVTQSAVFCQILPCSLYLAVLFGIMQFYRV